MIDVDEATTLLRRHVADPGVIRVPVGQAGGALLREAVQAERDQPPFDRVMMDGFAIRHAAWTAGRRRFVVQHTQAAGQPARTLDEADGCVEIMTGAALPAGADTIVPVERTRRVDAAGSAGFVIEIDDIANEPAQFIHRAGSDYRAGTPLLECGTRLGGPEMAVLASSGLTDVAVARMPSITVVAVGDELVGPGDPVAPFQIRRSNDFGVAALLHDAGFGDVDRLHLPDDPAVIEAALAERLEVRDALVLSGGVSMGKFDYIPRILDTLGVDVVFHKVTQRPGKPMWFGVSRAGKPVFALPGNPVSTLVCARRHVVSALLAAAGALPAPPVRVRLDAPVECPWPLTTFVPACVSYNGQGVAEATPRPTNTSGDFASLAGTDGIVEIPRDSGRADAGDCVYFHPWRAA